MTFDNLLLFGGSASPMLTRQVASRLGIRVSPGEVLQFSEGNLFVRVLESVRRREVFLIQSTGFQSNDNFMELLFWVDALKRASADAVTVVVPFFSYAKGDKKDEPRVSIRARVCADALQAAGADRLITMDLHAPQIQGFFEIPVDDLYALPVLGERVKTLNLSELVVVAPDTGFVKKARKYARYLGAPLAIVNKERRSHDEYPSVEEVIGDVKGRTVLIVDDFVSSGGTLVEASHELVERGARGIYAAVTHGAFGEGSMKRIDDSPISRLLITDTIETQPVDLSEKVEVVSVAGLFAEAIRRVHDGESISVLFEDIERTKPSNS